MNQIYCPFKCFLLLFLFSLEIKAQDTTATKFKKRESKIQESAGKLSQSLVENNEAQIGLDYENLANQFVAKGDNVKAEEYFKKAINVYKKQNLTNDKVRATRSLAKTQEAQKNYKDAAASYEIAGKDAINPIDETVNLNDYNRISNTAKPNVQMGYANSNIAVLEKEKLAKKEDIADAYIQKADLNVQQKNTAVAVQNYNEAIQIVGTNSGAAVEIQSKIASAYADGLQYDKAIGVSQAILKTAQKQADYKTQIVQLQSLGGYYLEQKKPKEALKSLQKAYDLAIKKGNTGEAKKSVLALIDFYKSTKSNDKIMNLYADFFRNFDLLIRSDTALIDDKTFLITEQKIRQLEKEKALKDELISKKNKFNYFLIGAMLLLSICLGLIAKALFSIKKKNKKIALQSLRREMNPHFIFNSLNSVNQFISENKELEANKYLTSYSNLMRTTMEYSNKDFITLGIEIEQLKKYLALEHLRFPDKFDYAISVDDTIDVETFFIPNMILQPHLENAIWHGLRYLESKGKLDLLFKTIGNKVQIIIEDNGIGLTKSKALKTQNQLIHKSRGIKNTAERIALLNDLYKSRIELKISEKTLPKTGTIVEIIFPLIDKI